MYVLYNFIEIYCLTTDYCMGKININSKIAINQLIEFVLFK